MNRHFVFIALVIQILSCRYAAAQGFVPLFDGKTLDGWEIQSGLAKYHVEDGAIVGTSAKGGPNSFLCTTKDYGDFVLEFETKMDPSQNSGVQIRSHRSTKDSSILHLQWGPTKLRAGRVYGYQVEIAEEESPGSGSIYDESRHGWLNKVPPTPAAGEAYKDNQWNQYRVVAIGDSIKTWVNGVPCADIVNPIDQTGFIGLQVHATDSDTPAQVRWRNIRIKDLGRHVWKPVWGGKTLDGWKQSGGGVWNVENGTIHAHRSDTGDRNGLLISERSFKDVTAQLKFRLVKGNSGFFVRADRTTLAGYEVRIDGTKNTGSLYEAGRRKWLAEPRDHSLLGKDDDWNVLTASMHGHRIVIHVNGVKTVELADDTQGRLKGHLALQIDGSSKTDIFFKDIEVLQPIAPR